MKKGTFNASFQLIRFNCKSILLFECLYKLIAWAIFSPALVTVFHWSLRLSERTYITTKNIIAYLAFPTTPFLLLFIIVIGILFMALELIALVHALDASYHHVKIKSKEIWLKGLQTVTQLIGKRNIKALLLLMAASPVLGFLLSPTFFPEVKIPEFIGDFIVSNYALNLLATAMSIAVLTLVVRWMYVIHCFALLGKTIPEAIHESSRMTRKHFFKNLFSILNWTLFIVGITLLLLLIGFVGVALISAMPDNSWLWLFILTVLVCLIGLFAITILAVPLQLCIISMSFYRWRQDHKEVIAPYKKPLIQITLEKKLLFIVPTIALCAFTAIALAGFIQKVEPTSEIVSMSTQITAHRGYTEYAVENTLSSFEDAISHHFDYIELDVQPTKDGVPVVFHDTSLKRLCGHNEKLSDTSFAELLDISLLNTNDETIPTLQEVLYVCRGKIKLNIELKCFDENFIQDVISLLEENEMLGECVITSLDYDALQKVKACNPEVTTGYVSAIAYGDIASLEYADIFSVEASFATQVLVDSIHSDGKKIFVWTVNNKSEMQRIFDLGVDSIVTDRPNQAMKLRWSAFADFIV